MDLRSWVPFIEESVTDRKPHNIQVIREIITIGEWKYPEQSARNRRRAKQRRKVAEAEAQLKKCKSDGGDWEFIEQTC